MSSILIVYDGTPSADRLLRRAAAIHRPGDAIDVVAVEEGTLGAASCSDRRGEFDRRLLRARGYLASQGISIAELARPGDPLDALIDVAAAADYDIVLSPLALRRLAVTPPATSSRHAVS